MNRKNIITSIIKWLLIIGVLVAVYFWQQDNVNAAFKEMTEIPWWINLAMMLTGLLYFIFEGRVISDMTESDGGKAIGWGRGILCSLYCEFYRLLTVGSATGVAQIFYYNTYGIDAGRATGLCLIQYTIQKVAVCALGLGGFLGLLFAGQEGMSSYVGWILLGLLVTVLIVTFLLLLALSKRFAEFLKKLVAKIFKKKPEKVEDLSEKIDTFNEAGHTACKNKPQLLKVFILDLFKRLAWYAVPAILFGYLKGTNPVMVIAFVALINMLSGVMVSPAGVGTTEFLFVTFFTPVVGATVTVGILMYRFYTWIFPFFLGAFVAAFRKRKGIDNKA